MASQVEHTTYTASLGAMSHCLQPPQHTYFTPFSGGFVVSLCRHMQAFTVTHVSLCLMCMILLNAAYQLTTKVPQPTQHNVTLDNAAIIESNSKAYVMCTPVTELMVPAGGPTVAVPLLLLKVPLINMLLCIEFVVPGASWRCCCCCEQQNAKYTHESIKNSNSIICAVLQYLVF